MAKEQTIDRRTMVGRSAAALAATLVGGVVGSETLNAQARQGTSAPAASSEVARIRRVVTGHNAQGRSYVVSDELVPERDIWITSAAEPAGPGRPGEKPGLLPTTAPQTDPPAGGSRWTVSTMRPGRDPKPTLQNRQGFHRTATIDYVYVLSGEIVLLLDQQEVLLKTGDVVIQRNTDHAWRVDGQAPARMLVALIHVG